jgi:hypothetical protein
MTSTEIKLQGWTPDFERPRDRHDDEDLGGVLESNWFNVCVTFQSLDDAMVAAREFRDHGYTVEFLDQFDDYSNATFVTISRPAGTATLDQLFDEAIKLAAQLDGDADNAWIA